LWNLGQATHDGNGTRQKLQPALLARHEGFARKRVQRFRSEPTRQTAARYMAQIGVSPHPFQQIDNARHACSLSTAHLAAVTSISTA
jgi:hypothetical protein